MQTRTRTLPTVTLPVLALLGVLAGCSGERNWRVSRTSPETVADVDYRFDDEDARSVARGMIADALSKPWLDVWQREHEGRPIMVVGNIRNDTEDYINSDLFTDPIREELLNSGRVRVKLERDLRAEVRQERLDTGFNDPETVKAVAKEVNADFMLLGRMKDVKERSRDQRTVISYYQITLELVNIETNESEWIQTEEIKKIATR